LNGERLFREQNVWRQAMKFWYVSIKGSLGMASQA
jgi:hypothetical protein